MDRASRAGLQGQRLRLIYLSILDRIQAHDKFYLRETSRGNQAPDCRSLLDDHHGLARRRLRLPARCPAIG